VGSVLNRVAVADDGIEEFFFAGFDLGSSARIRGDFGGGVAGICFILDPANRPEFAHASSLGSMWRQEIPPRCWASIFFRFQGVPFEIPSDG
jgi:hypothetical protein